MSSKGVLDAGTSTPCPCMAVESPRIVPFHRYLLYCVSWQGKRTNPFTLNRTDFCYRVLRFLLSKSKECQILSWNSTHKYNCQDRSVTHEDNDKASAREEKNLTSWLNTWSQSLCTTATASLDLANHDLDYLLNHWYVSYPARQSGETNKLFDFQACTWN